MKRIPDLLLWPMRRLGLSLVLVGTICGGWAAMADADIMDGPTITVIGEGHVTAIPDMATVTLGAVNRDDDPVVAINTTSQTLQSFIARLDGLGIESRDMQTSNLTLIERETYNSSTGLSVSEGYEARNTLTVRIRDLNLVGQVLANVLEDGANRLEHLQFGLQNPKPAQNQARRLAVADAMEQATLYADAAGVTLGGVLRIAQGSAPRGPQPMMAERAFVADSPVDVPVEAGEIEARAQVTMIFAIQPVVLNGE